MRLGGGGQHSAQMLCTEVLPPGVQPHHLKQTAPVMEPQSQPPIVMKDTTNSISQQQPIVITPHVSAPQPLSNRSAQQTVRSGGYSGMPPTSYQNTMTMPSTKEETSFCTRDYCATTFYTEKKRKILYIVDPNTGKDIISDVMSTRSTPPASTGSGSRGRTLMRLLRPSTEVLPPGVQPHHLKQTAPVMEPQSQPPIVMKDTTNSISQQQPIVITTCLSSPTTEQ
ncbi:unnamed protein product [Mytilus edulis]|uniref:Uncharacterized protein n=1 Tax=Mytilus edulis TaxID=6550 RepID=A0A8S3QLP3_MYTED|nr:unnamed protein product [Mytilus edulis]